MSKKKPANDDFQSYRTDPEGYAETVRWNGKPLPKREYEENKAAKKAAENPRSHDWYFRHENGFPQSPVEDFNKSAEQQKDARKSDWYKPYSPEPEAPTDKERDRGGRGGRD